MKLKMISVLVMLVVMTGNASAERPSLGSLQKQIDELTLIVKGLQEELTKTRAELANVQSNTVLGLNGKLKLENVNGQDTALFEGVNVQLINGAGMTAAMNGVGNLIIGYNVDSSGLASRIGSHNIILGDEESYPDTEKLITGYIDSNYDLLLSVAGNMDTVVGSSQQTTVGTNQAITVGANQSITVGTDQTTAVGSRQATTVGADKTLIVGRDSMEQIAGMSSTSIGSDASLSIGSNLNLNIAKASMIDAGDELVLKTGAALQTMKKNGDITIQGKNIIIKASRNLVLKGSNILQN